jgi:hypothetical protein
MVMIDMIGCDMQILGICIRYRIMRVNKDGMRVRRFFIVAMTFGKVKMQSIASEKRYDMQADR